MENKYACYCGLYCKTCPVKTKVEPAAQVLYKEMSQLGFEQIVSFFPNGEAFWSFLKTMSQEGVCDSCKAGSGNPQCKVRQCAQAKGIEMCALCKSYPCELFNEFFECYPSLKHNNEVLREQGAQAWEKMQEQQLKQQ